MKRILLGIMAVAMVMICAAPAMADFSVGLMSFTDVGYRWESKNAVNGKSSIATAFLDEAVHSRLYVKTSNENMSGYMELGMGFGGPIAGAQNVENVNFRKIFGDYKFGDFKLTVGHTERMGQSERNPSQLLGLNQGYIIGMGFGNLYTRVTQVRLEQRTGIWYWGISANTPLQALNVEGVTYSPTWNWAGLVGIRTDMFWATLDGNVSFTNAKDTPAGADSSATAWLVGLNLQGRFGFVTIEVNPWYGRNIGNIGYGFLSPADSVQVSATGKVFDSKVWGGWADVTIGGDPFLVHLIGGYTEADNDLFAEKQRRYMAVIRGEYKIAANFSLSPEFGYYNFGSDTTTKASLGSNWLAGVQFQFIF